MTGSRFHWADYVVTVSMLLVSLGIGFFFAIFRGGQKTKVAYLLGNREMSLGPVCLSLFVTFQSAISLIGTPADTYNTGPMIMYVSYGIALAYLVGYFIVVPVVYPLHLTSVYEYLELRFQSKAVRLLGTCIGMLQTLLYMAVALFSPALALGAAAGLPLWVSVVIVGSIGTIYTAVGGIKSVVWTDAFQTVIVFIGIGTVLIKGIRAVGGVSNMMDIADEGGRLNFAEWNPDPRERHSMWSCVIGGCVMWLVNCFNQSSVQRIGSLKTMKSAKIAFLLNVPLNMLYGTLLAFTGILLYGYVHTIGCDPYRAGLITNKNQMMPYFVIHVLDDLPGMAGLYMSMLFSGALSTVSSGINALAANTVEDILAKPLKGVKDTTVTLIAKVLVVFYGLVCIGLAYGMKFMSGPVTQLATTAFGACGGPLVGIFLLGGAFPRGNKYGAIFGGLLGLAVNLWIAVGARLYGSPIVSLPPGPTDNCWPFVDNATTPASFNSSLHDGIAYATDPVVSQSVVNVTVVTVGMGAAAKAAERPFSIYDISYLWFGITGVVCSFLAGVVISLLTGRHHQVKPDPKLIFPFCRKLYRLPEPDFTPDNTANTVAMQHYRQSWEIFKKSSADMNGIEDGKDETVKAGCESKTAEGQAFLAHGVVNGDG